MLRLTNREVFSTKKRDEMETVIFLWYWNLSSNNWIEARLSDCYLLPMACLW